MMKHVPKGICSFCFATGVLSACFLMVGIPGVIYAQETPPSDKPSAVPPEQEKETEKENEGIAQEHFETGVGAIRLKQWEVAIESLEKAVKEAPQKSQYHHALGIAYMGNKESNAGWYHFRRAVRLDPKNKLALVDFMRTWRLLDAQGLFNVGTPLPKIAQTLGKPDQVDKKNPRIRLTYGFMSLNFVNGQLFSILDLRNLPPQGLPAEDGLTFGLPPEHWKVGYRILSSIQGNTEYVKGSETAQSWTELFSSQRFINSAKVKTAVDAMNGIQKRLEERFGQVTFEVLQESEKDVLFYWKVEQTETHPSQQGIDRIVQGAQDIHRIAYTQKGDLGKKEEDFDHWTQILKKAELLPAQELRKYLIEQQQKQQERLIRDTSRKILEKQFELIKEKKVEPLTLFFLETDRGRITQDILEKVIPLLETLSIDELVDRVEITKEESILRAFVYTKEGEVFTTLIPKQGTWVAESVWFLNLVD